MPLCKTQITKNCVSRSILEHSVLYKNETYMKRYGYLYERIYDLNNLKLAHKNARNGKTHYAEVKIVDSNPDYYLQKIQKMLKDGTYVVSRYNIFEKTDSGKKRTIYVLPYYPDRIIQWAILQIIGSLWDSTFIENTYSSIKRRGIHRGVVRLKHDLLDGQNTKYCLKLDIKHFYPNIDHSILKSIIRLKIKDHKLLSLLDVIIDSAPGIPIGNYLSQYFGNLYLTAFDHWIKEICKMKYYHRYCDDIVIMAPSKSILHTIFYKIKQYLSNNLHMQIKHNYQVFPTTVRGIDFLGYRFFGAFTLLRKAIVKSMKRALNHINWNQQTAHDKSVVGSYIGWLSWCDCFRLRQKYISGVH
jgi:RNA-directed DNA polymerase